MDTTELIKNALDWADKRLTLQDQNLTETQRTYISFALSQNLVENFALSGVSQQRKLLEAYTKQIKEDNELTEEITFQDINKCIASNCG